MSTDDPEVESLLGRLRMDPDPVLEDDPAPPKKLRLIFTVVMPQVSLMSDPLVQRAHIAGLLEMLEKYVGPARVGVVAVEEDADGKSIQGR